MNLALAIIAAYLTVALGLLALTCRRPPRTRKPLPHMTRQEVQYTLWLVKQRKETR